MSRKFIAVVLASSIALTGVSATQSHAQSAQNRDAQAATLFLGAAAAILLLNEVANGSDKKKSKSQVNQHKHVKQHIHRDRHGKGGRDDRDRRRH